MLGENKNLKDPERKSLTSYGAGTPNIMSFTLPYTKVNKLITALYMVTDTMDKDEPIRLKLRTLGIEILSDITDMSKVLFDIQKLDQILSFLNIAFDIGMISEMNYNILRKEFMGLKQSIQEFMAQKNLWLEEFVKTSSEEKLNPFVKHPMFDNKTFGGRKGYSKGQDLTMQAGTRIGVQKGSTLLKALNKIGEKENFGTLKNKRREEIIAIIKDKKNTSGVNGATITDIKNRAKETLISCGEKTLQRELVSMVKDNILYRKGSKRWSQYFLQ